MAKTNVGIQETLPLKSMLVHIMSKGNLTQGDVESALGLSQGYLSKQLKNENERGKVSAFLKKRLEMQYEFILTGRKTIEVDHIELINKMADELIYLREVVEVLLTEVAVIQKPQDSSGRRGQLTKTAKAAAGKRLRSL